MVGPHIFASRLPLTLSSLPLQHFLPPPSISRLKPDACQQRSPKLPNQSCNRHHPPTNYRRESVRALARVSRWCCSCRLMPFWWASSWKKALFMLQTSACSVKFCCSSCRIFFFSSCPLRAYDSSTQFTTCSTTLSRSLTPIALILGFGFGVF